jgi:hypothetical protein
MIPRLCPSDFAHNPFNAPSLHNSITPQLSWPSPRKCPCGGKRNFLPVFFVLHLFFWKAVAAPLLPVWRPLFIKVLGPVQIRVLRIFAGSITDAVGAFDKRGR